MNRRNLFKLIGGALCAAAMDLTGVKPRVYILDKMQPYMGEVRWVNFYASNVRSYHDPIGQHIEPTPWR